MINDLSAINRIKSLSVFKRRVITIGMANFDCGFEAQSDSDTGNHKDVIDFRDVNLAFVLG